MSLILVCGNATLDIVNHVDHYPDEDEEMRVLSQRVVTGGNAANTACVLAQHDHQCAWLGVLATDADAQRIAESLQHQQVNLQYAQQVAGASPVSYITLNQANGSRTIVHHRDLPELTTTAFADIVPEQYDWLHLEGRNIDVLAEVLPALRKALTDQPISLEIEKSRSGIEELIQYVDVVMFSRAYAEMYGFDNAAAFLQEKHHAYPEMMLTCTWGEQGAYAIDRCGELKHVVATDIAVVDTVGAGDTFNAGLIHGLATGMTLQEALQYAVALAGKKVGQEGLLGLV